MAEVETQVKGQQAVTDEAMSSEDTADVSKQSGSSWSNLWQIPTILASFMIIAGGIYIARNSEPEHDFPGAFAQIEELIDTGQLELAADLLEENVAPKLTFATRNEKGKFFALAAGILYQMMEKEEVWVTMTLRAIDDRYSSAIEFDFVLVPLQVEQWANVQIELGDFRAAKDNLTTLEVQSVNSDWTEEAQIARNRVRRRLVDHILFSDKVNFEDAMSELAEYRSDPLVSSADEMWAIAQQAWLRIQKKMYLEAIDQLQIDMQLMGERVPPGSSLYGNFYTLLARGYYETGEFDFAEQQVERALTLLDEHDPDRGMAYVTQGQIMMGQSRLEEAFDPFNKAVVDFAITDSYMAALLGRAEVHGILGRHLEAQSDYEQIAREISKASKRSEITPIIIGRSLIERHDAALATQRLNLALSYIELTERVFPLGGMPGGVLQRLASTNRAIANEIIDGVLKDTNSGRVDFRKLDPAIQRQLSIHYKRAGEYYGAYSDSLESTPTADQEWLDALWNAADSFDLSGYYDDAIVYFKKYVSGRTNTDPRELEAMYRLGKCFQAILAFDNAIELFQTVISENPKSPWATKSHVPLAASMVAVGRTAEAEMELLRALEGSESPLQPEALDYRDALIALGTLYHNLGQFTRAIEELDRAMKLYPGDARILEIKFRLADSYRRNSHEILERLQLQTMPRSEETSQNALRINHLNDAKTLFAQVIESYESINASLMDQLQHEHQRLSHLYVGDCAYELQEYREAINLYDRAARKYEDHASSLVALIQIVNALFELDDLQAAKTAHNRAILRLKALPREALSDAEGILGRKQWTEWVSNIGPGIAGGG